MAGMSEGDGYGRKIIPGAVFTTPGIILIDKHFLCFV